MSRRRTKFEGEEKEEETNIIIRATVGSWQTRYSAHSPRLMDILFSYRVYPSFPSLVRFLIVVRLTSTITFNDNKDDTEHDGVDLSSICRA